MKMRWRTEVLRAAVWIVVLAALGQFFFQAPVIGALVGACGLLVEQWLTLYKFGQWLEKDSESFAVSARGPWAHVLSRLDRWQRQKRKRKKRLRKVISRFRSAVEAIPDGVVVLGEGAEVLWVNDNAANWLSLRSPQDVRRPITRIVRTPGFAEYIAEGRYDEPFDLLSPTGDMRNLRLQVVPYDKDRRLLWVRDVTRIQRLEAMRKDFVANVSHELRSPLTVVLGYLETLSDDAAVADQWRRPLEQMTQQADRMRLIVDDLMRLAQMEADPGGAVRVPIKVIDLLERVRDDATRLSEGQHQISVVVNAEQQLLGDSNEIYSAISNLVFNAVQYTPAGGAIDLSWSIEASEDSDENAAKNPREGRLAITDTGVGIDSRHVPRLTERFYRVDKARSRQLGGTGLGLAIVKHVLARHDARLEIESAPGEGSTFTCVFPAERVQCSPKSSEARTDQLREGEQPISTQPPTGISEDAA